jgi:hypothetical protein
MKIISIEARRNMSATRVGRRMSEETKQKLRGIDHRPFPAKCTACANREKAFCVRYNITCRGAWEVECFRRWSRRSEHPDYIKGTK